MADTGIGIAAAEQAHIFDSFYRIDDLFARNYGGVGLGLAVVKTVAAAYAGQIEFESEPDRGSCFTLKIPAALPVTRPDALDQQSEKRQRILIVDDEETVALTLQAGLEKLPNCEIITAAGGEQALQLFKRQPFDLLLTDYKMPGIDGLTLAARVRQLYPHTVIIMITAYSDDYLNKQAADISIRRVLDKPVEFSEIRRAASEALSGKA